MIGMAKSTQKTTNVSSSKTKDLSPSKLLAIVANWNNTAESPAKSPKKRSSQKRPRDEKLSASVPRSRRQKKSFRKDYLSHSSDDDELPTFKAKSFYHGAKPGRYMSPLERKEERDRLIDLGVDPSVLNKSFEHTRNRSFCKDEPGTNPSSGVENTTSATTQKSNLSISKTPSAAEKGQARPKRLNSNKPAEPKVQSSTGQMSGVRGEIKVTLSERPSEGNVDTKRPMTRGHGGEIKVTLCEKSPEGSTVTKSPPATRRGVKGEIRVTLSERSPRESTEGKIPAVAAKAVTPARRSSPRSSPRKAVQSRASPKVTKGLVGGQVQRRMSPRKLATKGNAAKGIQMYMKNLKQGQKKGKKAAGLSKSKQMAAKTKNQAKVTPPAKADVPVKTSSSKPQEKSTPNSKPKQSGTPTLKTRGKTPLSTKSNTKINPLAGGDKTARGLNFGTGGMANGNSVTPLMKSTDGRNEKSPTEDNFIDFLVFNDEDFHNENRETENFVQNLLMEIDNDLEETENLLKRSPRKRKMKTDKECMVLSPSPGKSPKRQTPNRRRISSTPVSAKKSSQPSLDCWLNKIDYPPSNTRSPRKKATLKSSEVKGQTVAGVLTPESASASPPKISPNKPTKLYPVFTPPTSPNGRNLNTTPSNKQRKVGKIKSPKESERSPFIKSLKSKTDNLEQTTLDLGQKRYGAVTCATCGTVYTAAHPEDETDHARFHKKYLSSIKFPGWKQEEVLEEFHDGRIIVITHEAPHYAEKKVDEIRELVDRELGFLDTSQNISKDLCKTYLFITQDKKVGGCLIAEQISKGYRVIVDEQKAEGNDSQKAWCCETESEPALCGISRIWVPTGNRRKRIASRMVDCLRKSFTYGMVLSPDNVAFSDPTPDGKIFATKYTGTPRFLVYKYH